MVPPSISVKREIDLNKMLSSVFSVFLGGKALQILDSAAEWLHAYVPKYLTR